MADYNQAMNNVADAMPGFEVMVEPFMAIPQAVGVSSDRTLAADFISSFVKKKKLSGFVRQSLEASGHGDVTIPR